MLKKFSLNFVNTTLQHVLSFDDNIQQTLKPLANKVMAIHLQGIDKTVFCLFKENTVAICDDYQGDVNVTLSGGPFSLLAILIKKDLTVSGVTIDGEIETAQRAKNLAEQLDIDWEDLLASKIGDTPAYHLHKMGNKLKGYFETQRQEFQSNLGDYLKDEAGLLVSPEQAEELYHGIDECRFHVDRLKARVQYLQNKTYHLPSSGGFSAKSKTCNLDPADKPRDDA